MPTHTIRIWDLPTRLFHWLLAASVVALVVTAKVGGNAMVWHFRLGYVVLALLAFRLVWGLVGGRWSRFASFVPTPGRLWRYLRGSSAEADSAGHSPLGALSVLALLGVLIAPFPDPSPASYRANGWAVPPGSMPTWGNIS